MRGINEYATFIGYDIVIKSIKHAMKNNYEITTRLALLPYLSRKIPINGEVIAPKTSINIE